jgi:hypothetical protein
VCSTHATHIDSFIHRLPYSIQLRSATQLIDFVGTSTTHSNERPKIPGKLECAQNCRVNKLCGLARSQQQSKNDYKEVLNALSTISCPKDSNIYLYVRFKTFRAITCCHDCFLLGLFFSLKMEATCSSETSTDYHGLHGFISKKTELLIWDVSILVDYYYYYYLLPDPVQMWFPKCVCNVC